MPFGGRSSSDLAPALYEALSGASDITDLLGQWQGSASIFTNRPVPTDAAYPICVCAGDVTRSDQDELNDPVPVIVRDISIFGQNTALGNVNQTRVCDRIALMVRDLFHRQRDSLSVDGWSVLDIVAQGPIVGPTDDDASVHRLITLTIRLS